MMHSSIETSLMVCFLIGHPVRAARSICLTFLLSCQINSCSDSQFSLRLVTLPTDLDCDL
jgi:hypothetical protein